SRTGVVNIYDRSCVDPLVAAPRPRKSILNLTTSVHALRFNHDAQIMGIASRSKKDQFKLVHLPSMTVFSNWPTSGYLAIGNDKGRVLLGGSETGEKEEIDSIVIIWKGAGHTIFRKEVDESVMRKTKP
ncbi:hypothetical protein BC938DRAFT_476593, partial [Jimgerdemannia flammicorona]